VPSKREIIKKELKERQKEEEEEKSLSMNQES